MFKTLQAFLLHKRNIYSENPVSIGQNGVKLQLTKDNQTYRQMNVYGQVKVKKPLQKLLQRRIQKDRDQSK